MSRGNGCAHVLGQAIAEVRGMAVAQPGLPNATFRGTWFGLFGKTLVVFLFCMCLAIVAIHGQTSSPIQWLNEMALDRNASGIARYLCLVVLLSTAGAPRQALSAYGGYVFGAAFGCLWVTLGLLAGCAVTFFAVRFVLGDCVQKRLSARLRTIQTAFAENPFTVTLMLRLCPVGNNVLVNAVAGASRVPVSRFFAATFVGYIPQNLIFSIMGSGISMGSSWPLAVSCVLFFTASLFGFSLYSRRKKE